MTQADGKVCDEKAGQNPHKVIKFHLETNKDILAKDTGEVLMSMKSNERNEYKTYKRSKMNNHVYKKLLSFFAK